MVKYKNILFCTDLSEDANIAFFHALDMANFFFQAEDGIRD